MGSHIRRGNLFERNAPVTVTTVLYSGGLTLQTIFGMDLRAASRSLYHAYLCK